MTSPNGTQAVDRAAQLLLQVVHCPGPVTFTELTAVTGLAKSTTSRLLMALGTALQRGRQWPSFELKVGWYTVELEGAAAVHAALAAVLCRVSFLWLPVYSGGELPAERSAVIRRLELNFYFGAAAAAAELPFRFDAAPALESVLLDRVYPSEAAPLLVALASDPNLPALRSVQLTLAREADRRYPPHPGPLAPLADGLRRALEQRAGGAAAGAAVSPGQRRVEVQREPGTTSRGRHEEGVIRAYLAQRL